MRISRCDRGFKGGQSSLRLKGILWCTSASSSSRQFAIDLTNAIQHVTFNAYCSFGCYDRDHGLLSECNNVFRIEYERQFRSDFPSQTIVSTIAGSKLCYKYQGNLTYSEFPLTFVAVCAGAKFLQLPHTFCATCVEHRCVFQ